MGPRILEPAERPLQCEKVADILLKVNIGHTNEASFGVQ